MINTKKIHHEGTEARRRKYKLSQREIAAKKINFRLNFSIHCLYFILGALGIVVAQLFSVSPCLRDSVVNFFPLLRVFASGS